MIDDSLSKMREYSQNAFIVPEYDDKRAAAQDHQEVGVLRGVLSFLRDVVSAMKDEEMGEATAKDVRDVISLVQARTNDYHNAAADDDNDI